MINTVPINTVDRTVFEIIRKVLVDSGLLPDITQYSDIADYEYAKSRYDNLVEIVGESTAEERGTKVVNSITITRQSIGFGSLGAEGVTQYRVLSGGGYSKEQLPSNSVDIAYDIRIAAKSRKLENLITDRLYGRIGLKRYVKVPEELVPTTKVEGFQIVFTDDITLKTTSYREKLIKWRVADVWLGDLSQDAVTVVPLTTIKIGVGIMDSKKDKIEKVFETEVTK